GGSTLLFESRAHNPILAPDGHQVTLAEFNAVQGQASVKFVPSAGGSYRVDIGHHAERTALLLR
ncbi:MAG: hypothetical protein DMF49_12250, partial [Acidobacteria bacterium]